MSVFTHLSLSSINIAAALCSAKAYNSAYAKGEQMINETMYARGAESSIIREIFSYGLERKAQIGAENVFDFSLGNPSVPAPAAVAESIKKALELPSDQLHGYTPPPGPPPVRLLHRHPRQRHRPGLVRPRGGSGAGLCGAVSGRLRPGECPAGAAAVRHGQHGGAVRGPDAGLPGPGQRGADQRPRRGGGQLALADGPRRGRGRAGGGHPAADGGLRPLLRTGEAPEKF